MESINNMSRSALEALSRENLSDSARKRLKKDLICGAISLSLLVAGLLYTYVLGNPYPVVPQLLYFIGFLIEGIPVIVVGIKGLLSKNMTNAMEILVAVAIVACVFNQDMILALLIPLILNIVHMLEERSIMGGRDVIDNLMKMQQNTAILYKNGEESEVDVTQLKVGQIVLVRPGSGVPIDGMVVQGKSNIDQKSLTGEPEPAFVKEGDPVYAGTVNLDGRLLVEVKKEHEDTTFSKILDLLEQYEGSSAPETRIIDQFLAYYIPFVLAVAAAVALVTGEVSQAIAILVVSCPCGHMLVSSAPMIAALAAATKRGILIKNSKFIEELAKVDTVVFDKTGTITKGELSMSRALVYNDVVSQKVLLTVAASLAVGSEHPASRAVMEASEQLSFDRTLSVREVSGCGVEAVNGDGKTIRFGRREWLVSCGCKIPADFPAAANGSVSYVSRDDTLLGCLCFEDTERENAGQSIAALRDLGVEKTVMLTGDREEPAEAIREKLGIDELFAKLLPQDKLNKLRAISGNEHSVLAVGDGINDALILREADVGVAMGAMGSDLAIESADIALMNNNLMNIPYAVHLARNTRKVIFQNLLLSIGISVVMIALSAFGVISALAGSILHNFGAFAVLLNSSKILKEAGATASGSKKK